MTERIHACFISYRHPAAAGSREEKLIGHVVKAISDHVQIYTHEHEVYFDKPPWSPGTNTTSGWPKRFVAARAW